MRESKYFAVAFTASGFAISTPATLSASNGYLDPPDLRNVR